MDTRNARWLGNEAWKLSWRGERVVARFSFVRSFSRFYRVSFSLSLFSSTDASFISLFSSSKSLRGGEMEASESDGVSLARAKARRGRG